MTRSGSIPLRARSSLIGGLVARLGEPCPWRRRIHAALRDRLPDPSSEGVALDAGCGEGLIVKELLRRLPNWRVVGVDRDPGALSRLPNSSRVTRRRSLLQDLQEERAYDLVVAFDAVHQNPGGEGLILRKLVRSLRPRGRLLLLVPSRSLDLPSWRTIVLDAGGAIVRTEALRTWGGRMALALYRGLRRHPALRLLSYPLSLSLMSLESWIPLGRAQAWLLEVRHAD